jgi:hypothetical protein
MIITLCGSARFEPWFHMWNEALGLAGHAAFGLCSYPSAHGGNKDWYDERMKGILDEVHLNKIRASEAVLFLNVFAYMGKSTMSEFAHARDSGKKIYFLESWGEGLGVGANHKPEYQDAFHRFGCRGGSPIRTCDYNTNPLGLLGEGASVYRSQLVARLKARETAALGFAWGAS